MQDIASPPQANAEVVINENFRTVNPAALYGIRQPAATGLTWAFYGGQFNGNTVNDGTVTLTASSTNYIVADRSTGAVSVATSTTNWNNSADYMRLYSVVAGSASITSYVDYRQAYGDAGGGGGITPAPLITDATSGRDFGPSDAGSYVRFTASGSKTATFDVADGFSAPEEYHIANRSSAGNLTLIGTGVTLNAPKGGTLVLEPGDTVTVKFVDTDEADVFGSTEAA